MLTPFVAAALLWAWALQLQVWVLRRRLHDEEHRRHRIVDRLRELERRGEADITAGGGSDLTVS